MSYYADPDSYGGHTLTTPADVTRAKRLAAQLAILFPAASVADRLPAKAAPSASCSEESSLDAGALGSAVSPGPASMVGSDK